MAARPASLAYRIVADGPYEPAHIAWDGTSDRSAEDLIGRTRDEVGGHSKTAELSHAMRELLESHGGSMAAAEAYRALEAQGFDTSSKDNLMRARAQAGVRTAKKSFDGPWFWHLGSSASTSEPSDSWQTKPPKVPKSLTKVPKSPTSRTREEPVSSTTEPIPNDGAATLWGEDQSLLQGNVPTRTGEM